MPKGRPLTFRVVLYLSFALLPLGLIAVLQSLAAVDAARESYRASLAAQTFRAARPEAEAIVRAFGIARGLAHAVPALLDDPERCANTMARTAGTDPAMTFAGFIGADRVTVCNSARERYDFAGNPEIDRTFAAGISDVRFTPFGEISGEAVVIVSVPVRDDGDGSLLGFVSLSFPTTPLVDARERVDLDEAVTLLTLDAQGEVLTADIEEEALAAILPADLALADLVGGGQRVFTARSVEGTVKDYAVTPIVSGQAYALGVWDTPEPLRTVRGLALQAVSFPLLMWLASLGVAVWSLRQLVIEPVRVLSLRMRAFAERRTMFQANSLARASREFREIGAAFETLANRIVQDEAELEDRVHERELLLREVHHRVKNNLQLMSSIINMQIRQSEGGEAEEALRRVQGRLASLAKFHQDLYETSALSQLRADELIEDLARQMVAMNRAPDLIVDLVLDLDPVVLPPDFAGPLAMLVTEALTNALKYAGPPAGERVVVEVSMKEVAGPGGATVVVRVANSLGDGFAMGEEGLGTRLIRAFAGQLDGRADIEAADGRYLLEVRFARPGVEAADGV